MTIFQRIMRVRKSVIFRHENGHYGFCWTHSERPITINIGIHERKIPSRTYLHECLHLIYPDMSERDIRHTEQMLWMKLTPKQRFLLARKLYNRKWRTG